MVIHLQHSRAADQALEQDEGRSRARLFGEEATGLYPGEAWNTVEPCMAGDWGAVRGNSALSWAQVRNDAHAAWQVAKLHREGRLRDDAPVFAATG